MSKKNKNKQNKPKQATGKPAQVQKKPANQPQPTPARAQSSSQAQAKQQANVGKLPKPGKGGALSAKQINQLDSMVKQAGEQDLGAPKLDLCPRCGSGDLTIRKIDIPGFAPEVQVCAKCGFRSESPVQVSPVDYVEELEEEVISESKIEEIQRRLQKSFEEGQDDEEAGGSGRGKRGKPKAKAKRR